MPAQFLVLKNIYKGDETTLYIKPENFVNFLNSRAFKPESEKRKNDKIKTFSK